MGAVAEMAAERVAALLAPWRERRPDRGQAEAFYRALNATRADVFVFVIADGVVTTLDKPAAAVDADVAAGWRWRARLYRRFLQDVVAAGDLRAAMMLAMSMEDFTHVAEPFPMFAFQRAIGREDLLLPDIDAVHQDFYAGFSDALGYDEKIDRAIFIGSTSGATHSVASVAALSCPRLRAGVFFRESAEVVFRLPNIVQCADAAAEAAIRALGFGVGAAGWDEQLRYRLILSMDGNGATCSRPAKALASNSVLVKYGSGFELHYSSWLQPWRHFVPVAADADVLGIVAQARAEPERFARVAAAGTQFFRRFLSRAACIDYTVRLLRGYAECFVGAEFSVARQPAGEGNTGAVRLSALVHIAGRGDCLFEPLEEAGTAGSGLAIEGFEIETMAGLASRDLTYRALDATGADAPWQACGRFAGTRSQARPLLGLAVRLQGAAAARWRPELRAGFVDGSTAGPVGDGVACRSASGAALEWFRMEFASREASALEGAGMLRLGVLNADPLVVLCAVAAGEEAVDVASLIAAAVGRRFGLIVLPQRGVRLEAVAGWVRPFCAGHPHSRVWIAGDGDVLVGAMGMHVELLPRTAFVDETVFRPAAAARRFDAIYVAAMEAASRHELAALLDPVCLVDDAPSSPAGLDEVRRFMPQAVFAVAPGGAELARLMQASGVGLLLAPGQENEPVALHYALCGLPIVCAPGRAGGDAADWVSGCAAHPTDVADAVRRAIGTATDRQGIRRAAMEQLAADRTLWRRAVQRLCAQLGNGAANRFGNGLATFRAEPTPWSLRSVASLPGAGA